VVETGLSAKRKAHLSATRFPLFTDAVTRQSNQSAARKNAGRPSKSFSSASSDSSTSFQSSRILQSSMFRPNRRSDCCAVLKNPVEIITGAHHAVLKRIQPQRPLQLFNLSNSCKRKDPGIPFLALKPYPC
jgi:hypothetical protein